MALLQADADVAHPIALAPVPGTSLIDYVKVLRKRAWMIAVVAVTITIAATIFTVRMIKIYDAVARINIGRESAQPFKYRDNGGANAEDYSVDVDTQVHILTSDGLALQVAKKLHLDRELASAGGAVPGITVAQETSLIGQVKGGLHILAIPNTRLIELRYSDPDPRFAAELLNTLIQTYIDQSRKSRYQSAIQAADWLAKQLADLQVKVETSQEKLVQYQRAHDILGTDDKQNLTTSKLEQLNHEFTSAQSERIQKQALYEWAKNSNSDLPPDVGSDLLTKLRQEQVDIKNELAQLTAQFGANYPKVVALNNRLREVENSISSEIVKVQRRVENEYYAAQQRERMVKAALDVQKQEANKLNENAIEFSLLKRDAESNRNLYDNLLQQMKEATIAAALNSSNIEVIDAARVPLSPSRPNVPRNV